MIVFKYFYEKMALFGPLMDEKEEQEKTQQEVDVEVDIEPMDQVSTATFVPSYTTINNFDSAPTFYLCCFSFQAAVLMPQPAQAGVRNDTKALTRSLVLAVSVCYHARLGDRKEYEKGVANMLTAPLALPGGREQFRNEIRW